jgi:antitoxin (DNA-binding transcriptional repressor) of toxin-antitoxin stability system
MKTAEPKLRQVPVTEFKARCTEFLRAVENGEPSIQITRHGKVIGILNPDNSTPVPPLLGAGLATGRLNPSYDPQAPAYDEDDWEINQ